MIITPERWLHVLTYCGVQAGVAIEWAHLFAAYVQPSAFSQGEREIDDFVGQVLHETGNLSRLTENLNYRAARLMEVWPKRFPTLAIASQYQYQPEKLANFVYGGRMGNNREGDGFQYIGRGIPMITGKDNYQLLEDLTGMPLVAYPSMLSQPEPALRCAILWWEKRVPDSAIDSLERVSRAVNGGTVGLQDRRILTARAKAALDKGPA